MIFKKTVSFVYVYSTHPKRKIVGKFTIKKILKGNPNNLWEITKKQSGLNKIEFFNYFKEKNTGYAIEIDEFGVFNYPIDPKL